MITEIKKIEAKKLTLLEMRTANEVTPEEYLLKKNEYTNDIKGYEGKIAELPPVVDEKFELVENFAQIIMQAQEILESDDVTKKRQLAHSLSSNYFVKDGTLEISFKKPFSFF